MLRAYFLFSFLLSFSSLVFFDCLSCFPLWFDSVSIFVVSFCVSFRFSPRFFRFFPRFFVCLCWPFFLYVPYQDRTRLFLHLLLVLKTPKHTQLQELRIMLLSSIYRKHSTAQSALHKVPKHVRADKSATMQATRHSRREPACCPASTACCVLKTKKSKSARPKKHTSKYY